MALGLGSLKKKDCKSKKTSKSKSSQDADLKKLQKQMDEKSAAGDCPFC